MPLHASRLTLRARKIRRPIPRPGAGSRRPRQDGRPAAARGARQSASMPDPDDALAPPAARPAGVEPSPCLACGACCAAFRVSFYWAEAPDRGLPEALVERVSDHLLCMRGTWAARPRCAALDGEVGHAVACTAYERRPSPCREVQPGDERCARAREIRGLPPLAPA